MARIRDIVFDCASNAAALARFWAEALDGYAIRPYDDAEVARLAERGLTPDTDPQVAIDGPGRTLWAQQVQRERVQHSPVHLDLVGEDRKREVERLCALGATVRDVHEDYTVLLDPAGNPFCVVDPD